MDAFSFLSALSATTTVVSFIKRFVPSLSMKTSPTLANQVNEVIEDFKKAQEDNNDLLISSLKEIPQLSEMRTDYLKTQFENILKEFSNSNIAQLNHSNNNQITQTTQNYSGSGDNVRASGNIINIHNYAPPAPEKPSQIDDKDNMYKVLNAVKNLRENKQIKFDDYFTAVSLSINKTDFYDAVELAIEEGYIKGLFALEDSGGKSFLPDNPRLTPQGREFLEQQEGTKLQKKTDNKPCILISHSSKDEKYGNVLQEFITRLGIEDTQLIYTSHALHPIPLGEDIYEYLREVIRGNVFVIFLHSDSYYESSACLNEMGAAWLVKTDYTNIYIPSFNFSNPKYFGCAINKDKKGIILNGDEKCKTSFFELKDKITSLFSLNIEEKRTSHFIDKAMEELKNLNKNLVDSLNKEDKTPKENLIELPSNISDSNIAQLNNSNNNQITQTTQNHSGTGDNVGRDKNVK